MQIEGLAQKVTVYIGESDKWQQKPLYSAILEMLRKEDCAGATVTRAIAGFGANSRIHTASIVALSADLPLIIEWVDNPARVERVMPHLRKMVGEGLITVQNMEVVAYTHRRLRELAATLPVRDVMSREVHAVEADTSLVEAVELLIDKIYRALPVVDKDRHVVGILTEGDLLDATNLLATGIRHQLTQAEMATELQRLRQAGQTIADVMTPNPITVTGKTTITQAVQLMIEHHIKRLPVVNPENTLMGILSRVDVLRALSQLPVTESPRQTLPPGHHRQVEEIMMTHVPTVQADAALAEIVDLLISSAQRRVVVIGPEQRVVGIITDGDLIKRATPAERSGIIDSLSRRLPLNQTDTFRLSQRTATEVMTGEVITVTPDTALIDALQLLLTHRIKRLPVINAEGRLVGMVGRAGILQAIGHNNA